MQVDQCFKKLSHQLESSTHQFLLFSFISVTSLFSQKLFSSVQPPRGSQVKFLRCTFRVCVLLPQLTHRLTAESVDTPLKAEEFIVLFLMCFSSSG